MPRRLSNEELRLRAISEEEWMEQVTELAALCGYRFVHFRPAQTKHGWRVPVEGPLGKGWPDLHIVGRGRRIYVELKRETGDVSSEQEAVHAWIRANGGECYLWRPSDFEEVIRVLRGEAT